MMRVLTGSVMPHGDWPDFNTGGAKKFAGNVPSTAAQPYVGGMPVGFTATSAANTGFTFGGQSGQVVVTAPTTGPALGANSYVGLLYNNAIVDIRRATGDKTLTGTSITSAVPTVVIGPCVVELFAGVFNDVTDSLPPFLYGGVYGAVTLTLATAWAAGDMISIATHATEPNISGRLTPTTSGHITGTGMSQQTGSIGQVLKAPTSITDSMIAYIWGFSVQVY